eukprot:2101260-Rhodomonas_salina.1
MFSECMRCGGERLWSKVGWSSCRRCCSGADSGKRKRNLDSGMRGGRDAVEAGGRGDGAACASGRGAAVGARSAWRKQCQRGAHASEEGAPLAFTLRRNADPSHHRVRFVSVMSSGWFKARHGAGTASSSCLSSAFSRVTASDALRGSVGGGSVFNITVIIILP